MHCQDQQSNYYRMEKGMRFQTSSRVARAPVGDTASSGRLQISNLAQGRGAVDARPHRPTQRGGALKKDGFACRPAGAPPSHGLAQASITPNPAGFHRPQQEQDRPRRDLPSCAIGWGQ